MIGSLDHYLYIIYPFHLSYILQEFILPNPLLLETSLIRYHIGTACPYYIYQHLLYLHLSYPNGQALYTNCCHYLCSMHIIITYHWKRYHLPSFYTNYLLPLVPRERYDMDKEWQSETETVDHEVISASFITSCTTSWSEGWKQGEYCPYSLYISWSLLPLPRLLPSSHLIRATGGSGTRRMSEEIHTAFTSQPFSSLSTPVDRRRRVGNGEWKGIWHVMMIPWSLRVNNCGIPLSYVVYTRRD